jgi:hypothetical protein
MWPENWNQPILAPRKSVGRVAGHLKRELAIPSLVEQLSVRGLFYRQPTAHERSRQKSEILLRLLPLQTNARDGLRSPEFLFRNHQAAWYCAENRPG